MARVRLLSSVVVFWVSILNSLQITSKVLEEGYRYYKVRNCSGHTLNISPKMKNCFENMYQKDSYKVFYDDLVYKLRKEKYAANYPGVFKI